MALFESYERRIAQINKFLNDNGIASIEEAEKITKSKGLDIIQRVRDIQPICFENACWAYLVGAGGAGTAIEIQAALDGVAEMSIFNIKDKFWENAENTVKKINEKTNCKAQLFDLADHEALKREIDSSVLLANTTGCGMKPLEGMTWLPDKSYLRPDLIVTDTVYAPAETEFLRIAKEVGCKHMNGFGMMLFQGAAAFKLWTNVDMPIEHMKEVLGIHYGD